MPGRARHVVDNRLAVGLNLRSGVKKTACHNLATPCC